MSGDEHEENAALEHDVPADLVELHEILEWDEALKAKDNDDE